jgi:hypothetical protein
MAVFSKIMNLFLYVRSNQENAVSINYYLNIVSIFIDSVVLINFIMKLPRGYLITVFSELYNTFYILTHLWKTNLRRDNRTNC